MNYHLTDSHAHLFMSPLLERMDEVIEHAYNAGVKTIVNICIDEQSLNGCIELSKKRPWIYHAGAVHPHDVEKEGKNLFPLVEKNVRSNSFVAIGETGLDYYHKHSPIEVQQEYLRKHLRLALESKLPVIIHCRDAFGDLFKILDEEYQQGDKLAPGILHCFTGSLSEALHLLSKGWYISFSGVVTYKKCSDLREVAKIIPLDRLLIETDSPFLAPQSKRGRTNEPAYLLEVATVIAAVKGITLAELAQATTENAKIIFRL